MWTNPTTPNVVDYTSFLLNVAGLPAAALAPAVPLASLTWLSGIVTATTSTALYDMTVGDQFWVTIEGASPSQYNGNYLCTVAGANSFTYSLNGAFFSGGWTADSTTVTADSSSASADSNNNSSWTADSTDITADSSNVTADSSGSGSAIIPGFFITPASNYNVATTLSVALATTNETLSVGTTAANATQGVVVISIYTQAVYNLATDRLLNFALDQPNSSFFKTVRKNLRINDLTLGLISSASDGGTSMSQINPQQMAQFTLMDLQTLKTPFGRQYMAYAQMYGQTLWGLT